MRNAFSAARRAHHAAANLLAPAFFVALSLASNAADAGPPPAPTRVFTPGVSALDIQVAAGKTFLFVADAGNVAVYRKNGASTPTHVKNLDMEKLFNALYGPDDPDHPRPNNVNKALASEFASPKAPVPCLLEDPFDHRSGPGTNGPKKPLFFPGTGGAQGAPWVDAHPPADSRGKEHVHNRNIPTSSCISEFEDVRVLYDAIRDVYYVATAARNHFYPRHADSKDFDPTNVDANRHPTVAAQARRHVFLAVSKPGADPTIEANYHIFDVDDAVEDWPLVAVHADVFLVTHRNSSDSLRAYDAAQLAQGKLVKIGAWKEQDYKTHTIVPVKHHGTGTELYFAGPASDDEKKMAVNVLTAKGLVHGPEVKLPFVAPDWDAVCHDGRLYFVGTEGHAIRYLSFPAALRDGHINVGSGASSVTDFTSADAAKYGFRTELLKDGSSAVEEDAPSVEVTTNGKVVVSYVAAGGALKEETRYSVLLPNDTHFLPHGVLKAAAASSTLAKLSRIDFAKGWRDPDGLTVWMTGSYGSGGGKDGAEAGAVVGAITP
jgi:hypothetical protein